VPLNDRMSKPASPNAETPLTPVVYSMGKVATSSISSAMRTAGFPVHHIHSLNDKHLLKMATRSITAGKFPAPHICESMAWKERLFSKPELCLYISLVREPIARNLSGFFENIQNFTKGSLSDYSPEDLLAIFVNRYKHSIPLEWFDQEFKAQLGIDVYESKFDTQNKYVQIGKWNTVIFRADCNDQVVSRILSEALHRKLVVGRANDSSKKSYSAAYRAVKEIAKFSDDFLDSMYNTKYAQHFWTPEEISSFWEQWKK
jgi:hypothetical protein